MMRTALFLAIALLAVPVAAQQREPAITPAPSIPVEAEQSARTPPERQSLMGAVMGLLIQSAEQASADQASERRAGRESRLEADHLDARSVQTPETPARETREVAVHSGSPGT